MVKINFNQIFLFLLLFIFWIDPSDEIFNLKLTLTIFFFLYSLKVVNVPILLLKESKFLLIFLLFIPVIYYLVGSILGINSQYSFQILKAFILIFLFFPIVLLRIDFNKVYHYISLLISILTICVFIFYVNSEGLRNLFISISRNYDFLDIDPSRSYGEYNFIQIYLVACPVLIYGMFMNLGKFKDSNNKKFLFYSLLYSLSLLLAGSRGNYLAVFIYILFFLYVIKNRYINLVLYLILFYLIYESSQIISEFFNPEEASNKTKIFTLYMYFKIINDPIHLLLGQGIAYSDQYIGSIRANSSITEFTQLEIIRYFGLIIGLCMNFLIVKYSIILSKNKSIKYEYKYGGFGFLVFYLMSFFNPIFLNSIGVPLLAGIINIYFQKIKGIK